MADLPEPAPVSSEQQPEMTRRRLWLLSAGVQKEFPGGITTSHLSGYRLCATADEARGSFFTFVAAEKPGFAITEMLCMVVPDDTLRAALVGAPEVPNDTPDKTPKPSGIAPS